MVGKIIFSLLFFSSINSSTSYNLRCYNFLGVHFFISRYFFVRMYIYFIDVTDVDDVSVNSSILPPSLQVYKQF